MFCSELADGEVNTALKKNYFSTDDVRRFHSTYTWKYSDE